MALSGWRQFNFFDLTPVRDPSSPDEGLLYSDPNLSAVGEGRDDTIFLANSSGIIKEVDRDIRLINSFKGYDNDWNITHLKYLKGTSLLLTIGYKLELPLTIHLWNLDRLDKDGIPHLHSTVTVMNGTNLFPLTTFCISSDYSILGFGYTDGTVILVRGDIIRDRGSRQRIVYRSNSPITGLEFCEDSESGIITLMIATTNQILTVPTTGRNSGKPEVILDGKQGADLGCVTISDNKLVVARENEIISFTPSIRGNSLAINIPKKSIFSFNHYFIITTVSTTTTGNGLYETTKLLIIDTLNNFIAYSGQIAVGVKFIFNHWNTLHVIGSDGILYIFKEKDLDVRLDILKQRKLYDIAIELATKMKSDNKIIHQLEKEYGDFLYNQDQLSDALDHYITCIDLGNTSQIILKYKDSQNINYLTRYLEALHNKGLAEKQHTTLLFNSYAKLNNLDKLTKFIEESSDKTNIDYETAIKICRQAGYYSLAVYLAQKTLDSDLAVQIKLKDLKDYKGCLNYVKSLEVKDALRILIQFSRELLDMFPVETTALLIDLFTGKYVPKEMDINEISDLSDVNEPVSTPITPVLQSYRALVSYMSNGGTADGSNDSNGGNGVNGINGNGATTNGTANGNLTPTYQPPRPRLIFSSFINHPNEFVIFLEACLESYDKFEANEKDRSDLLSTLFEMYLTLSRKTTSEEEKQSWEAKAKDLAVSSNSQIDKNTILLLSHLVSYTEGELLARDSEDGFEIDHFRSTIASNDVPKAIEIIHKYGDKEHEIYPLALKFFISSPTILNQAGDEFDYVLNKIKEEQIMTPLQVVQALSVNSVATIGHVREYLVNLINHEKEEIDRSTKLSESYRNETDIKKEQIHKLLNDATTIQYTTCSSCNTTLDLPAIHFSCKHSYHQRCLNDLNRTDDEPHCPKCISELEEIKAIRQAQDDITDRNDLFELALNESENKFKVITDFISRGALTG